MQYVGWRVMTGRQARNGEDRNGEFTFLRRIDASSRTVKREVFWSQIQKTFVIFISCLADALMATFVKASK